jgi:hypothetical protein
MRQNDIERVRDVIRRTGVSNIFVAKVARVSRNRLNGVKDPDWSPRPRTLRKIVAAIDKIDRLVPARPAAGDSAAEGEA